MKRILALFIYLFTFSPFHLIMAQEGSLFVVHTSDTHSCIEPISPNFSDTAQADKGGYLRRVVLLEQLRKEHPQDCALWTRCPYHSSEISILLSTQNPRKAGASISYK